MNADIYCSNLKPNAKDYPACADMENHEQLLPLNTRILTEWKRERFIVSEEENASK